jgi:hypothetical protein
MVTTILTMRKEPVMNRKSIVVSLAAAAFLLTAIRFASAQPKGETVTLKGEVVDLWCYLEGGDKGADHKKCAVECAKAGNPIALLTEKGDIYVLAGIKDHQPAKDVLLDKMAENVTIEGTLVRKGGVQVVYVSSVK